LQREIAALEKKTAGGDFTLVVALSYGGRAEIVDAAKAWALSGEKDELTEEAFSKFLYAPDIPDPDLIIRTSGECRTSNFLMWESAYSEWYFTDVYWPDFNRAEFDKALESYSRRERRMGGRLK
jgi:undecaprenyl diphosphate synthase